MRECGHYGYVGTCCVSRLTSMKTQIILVTKRSDDEDGYECVCVCVLFLPKDTM